MGWDVFLSFSDVLLELICRGFGGSIVTGVKWRLSVTCALVEFSLIMLP